MIRLYTNNRWKKTLALLLLPAAMVIASPAQTFTTVANFGQPHTGRVPNFGALAQGLDGNFYGATTGGVQGGGTYKMTPSGKLTQLDRFDNSNGSAPYGGLVQASNGNLYGTTENGGATGWGTVFQMTPSGELTTLYSFCSQTHCTDGGLPYPGLVQAANGNFYGTTVEGGAASSGCNGYGCGTIFEITPSGTLTTLYSFCSQSNCTDGANPFAGLVQAFNGNFYGTTDQGGASSSDCSGYGCGTIFEITPSGTLTTLYSFCSQTNCADGKNPDASLLQAKDGSFYGASSGGGLGGGTIFKITPTGTLTTLYSFCSQSNCTDGSTPFGALIQATDGNLYGTTWQGGEAGSCNLGCGTIFKIIPGGTFTTLHRFDGTDGDLLGAGLVQATNGKLYGTTTGGGTKDAGTAFSLAIGLRPFVKTLTGSGKLGAKVIILGGKLTGSTGVSFNGTAATFTVVSDTEIMTTVPSGATSGFVTVTAPSGKLKSSNKFRVIG